MKLRYLTHISLIFVLSMAEVASAFLYEQNAYRWRNDDGGEASASWMAAQDMAITNVARVQTLRLRLCVTNIYPASYTVTPKLQYGTSTNGPWTDLGTNNSGLAAFEMTLTTNYANGDVTTGLIPGLASSFMAGRCFEKPSNGALTTTIGANRYSNFEYCLAPDVKARGNTAYYFRAAGLYLYSKFPKLTMAAGESNVPPVIVSGLSVTGSTEFVFSAVVQATGTEPITYTAMDLPAGLAISDGVISGTPVEEGVFDVDLKAANAFGTNTATMVLTVLGNQAPVASNQTLSVVEGVEKGFYLPWSDWDDPIRTNHTFTIVSNAESATVVSYAQKYSIDSYPDYWFYTPGPGGARTETLLWNCNDGALESNIGTVTVTVVANTAPVVSNSNVTISGTRTYVPISVADPDSGQVMTYTVVTAPAHGFLEFNTAVGLCYYNVMGDYTGTDSFQWKVSDGFADSGVATVTVTIPAMAPVPGAQTVCTVKNTPLLFTPSCSGGGGYTNTLIKVSGPANGSVVVSNGTQFLFVPASNFVGETAFTWKMVYANGGAPATSVTATCTVNVKDTTALTADWPQWRSDAMRQALTAVSLPDTLYLQWRRDMPTNSVPGRSEAVVLGNQVFMNLSGNDSVSAYSTTNGAMLWRFYASGAVRAAPAAVTLTNGLSVVIFGSDDGNVYCLNVDDGSVHWKFQAVPNPRKVMGERRLGSMWPIKGPPIIRNGKVFFIAGLFPMEGMYAYCLDVATGSVLWLNDGQSFNRGHNTVSGPLTISRDGSRLYVPGSYGFSWYLDTETGKLAGYLDKEVYRAFNVADFVDLDGNEHFTNMGELPVSMVAGARNYIPADMGRLGVAGTVSGIQAGDNKLFVTTKQGSLYCFGGVETPPVIHTNAVVPLPEVADGWGVVATAMVSRADLKQGLALVLGAGSGRLVEEMAKAAPSLSIVVVDSDPAKLLSIRLAMDLAGVSGARVSTLQGEPMSFGFSPYQAALIASEDLTMAGFTNGAVMLDRLYQYTRPFGGEIWLPTMNSEHATISGWKNASTNLPYCTVTQRTGFSGIGADGYTQIQRTGLPDSALIMKPPFKIIAYGEGDAMGVAITKTISRGKVSNYDVYTRLPFTVDMQGYLPTPPSNNNVRTLVREELYPGNVHNDIYDYLDTDPNARASINYTGYGCAGSAVYGDMALNSGVGGSMYSKSLGFFSIKPYWGILSAKDGRGECSTPSMLAGNGIIAAHLVSCSCCAGMNDMEIVMAPAEDEQENFIRYRVARSNHSLQEMPIKRVGINFGAIADRFVAEDNMLWTHHPDTRYEDTARDHQPLVPVTYRGNGTNAYHHSAQMERTGDRRRVWVSASCVRGIDGLTIPLAPTLVADPIATPVVMDGDLNDPVWTNGSRTAIRPPRSLNLSAVQFSDQSYVMLRYDDTNLYIGARSDGVAQPISSAYEKTLSQTIEVAIDSRDSLSSTGGAPVYLLCQPSATNNTSMGIPTNAWSSAMKVDTNFLSRWRTAEMVIPWSSLEAAGIWKEQMVMNVSICDAPLNGQAGAVRDYLTPMYLDTPRGVASQIRPYTVRLYFAEVEGKTAGQRVFDVKLQGNTVLSGLDVVQEAGGPRRELVKEFTNVGIADKLDIDFVKTAGEPMVSGVEIMAVETNLPNEAPVAVISASALSGPAPLDVILSARASYDPDGQIALCAWDTGDGRLAQGSRLRHMFAEPGIYRVHLLVMDNRGLTAATNVTVTVSAGVPAAFVCSISTNGGDYTNLTSWVKAIQSDLTSASNTMIFTVTGYGTYNSATMDGVELVFAGGGMGVLARVITNVSPALAEVAYVGGTVNAGQVSVKVNSATFYPFTTLDTGVPSRSLLFTVTNRNTYAASDDGKMVTFTGGGSGLLHHINGANLAYISKCRGTILPGEVTVSTGNRFYVSDDGNPIYAAVAEGYNHWPNGLADNVALGPWVTDERHAITIRAAAGQGHKGKRTNAGGTYAGFGLNGSLSAYLGSGGALRPLTCDVRIDRLIMNTTKPLTVGRQSSVNRLLGGKVTVYSAAVIANSVADLFQGPWWGANWALLINCTARQYDFATLQNGAQMSSDAKLINCLAYGTVASATNSYISPPRAFYATRCLSVDGKATVTDPWGDGREGNLTNRVVSFVDKANGDYRLALSDTGAREVGVMGLGADIDGTLRVGPTYDVGADQTTDNQPPVITMIQAVPASGVIPLDVAFSVAGTDSDGDPLGFVWTFGDGNSSTIQNPTHTYTTNGTFVATVTVDDGQGGEAVTNVTVIASLFANDPPTVATTALATPNPVTGNSTVLSVLGEDDFGETNLTYTWSTVGAPPAVVTYSTNSGNGAKTSTATFIKSGNYEFQVLIKDAGNLSVASAVTVTVADVFTTLTVAPASASVVTGSTRLFMPTAKNQFGLPVTPQPSFGWAVTGGGVIDASGLFTAGHVVGGPHTVSANSGGKTGTASVVVILPPKLLTVAANGTGSNLTIQAAINAAANGDIIRVIVSPHTESNITVNKSVTIEGLGADQTVVQGASTRRTAGAGIFVVPSAGKNVTFQDMTLARGYATGGKGGAINIAGGVIRVERCSFEDNDSAAASPVAGAIHYGGGGVSTGSLTILDSTFVGNVCSNNTGANSPANGGAVAVYDLAQCVIRNSTFTDNKCWYNNWAYGGAIYVYDNVAGRTSLVQNCTFVTNQMIHLGGGSSSGGGAISGLKDKTGQVAVASCVFVGNVASAGTGSDLYAVSYTSCVYQGTVVKCDNQGGNTSTNNAGVNLTLANNGGPTMTHALLEGSPAIDKGSNPAGLSYDQRGEPYQRIKGVWTDAGAFEFGSGASKGFMLILH